MFSNSGNRNYLEFLGLGAELALVLSVPIFAGYWLDLRWNSTPWMLLAGILTGILFVVGTFIRVIRKVTEKGRKK